jgi:hypothetical protein
VEFDNLADFGRTATVTLPILGELITRAVLVVRLPDLFSAQAAAAKASPTGKAYPEWLWTNSVGNAIASSFQLTIGEQIIDTIDSRLLELIDDTEWPVEHFISDTELSQRDPTTYPNVAFQKTNDTVEIVVPFWWNRGIGPQALPIQALAKDKVQIDVDFRTVQQLIYTTSRDPATSALPTMAGYPFYSSEILSPANLIPGHAMPDANAWHFQEAYWIVEYVSLEDREAAAFRLADLQIPIEQHIALPVIPTNGAQNVRIRLERGGLIRDLTWVAQRTEAPDYNAYFLFSKDLSTSTLSSDLWWPDARIPSWDYGDGYIRPAFCDRRSDPIVAAALYYRGKERFNFEGPSLFRSLIPALGCTRTPLVNRYIYRWNFGYWPTGGLTDVARDEARGMANWDVLPGRELHLTMAKETCQRQVWIPTGGFETYGAGVIRAVSDNFDDSVAGFRFELYGASPSGRGGYVKGVIDYQAIQALPGFQGLYVRTIENGSAALVAKASPNVWIAVAGGGGFGASGGNVSDAVSVSFCGGNTAQTHVTTGGNGGGGGGRYAAADFGAPDGKQMELTDAFIDGLQSTGGAGNVFHGGDGYYGGGSGSTAGGGGGSYVSSFVSETDSGTRPAGVADSSATLTAVTLETGALPKYNIHLWLTRYNMLRIYGGRCAVLFAE